MKLSWETKLIPNACLLRKAALSGFSPRSVLAIGTRRVWVASCSLCTGALQVIARAGKQLQTCSTTWRRWMAPEKSLCALAPANHIPQAMEGPTKAHVRKGTKLASGSCVRKSDTLLGKPSSAPMRVCSGKQRFPVSPLGLCLPWAKDVLGFLLLPGHWFCAGGRWS